MSPVSRWARSAMARALATTAARQRTLVVLIALPLAAAVVAGVVLGDGAERGGWGAFAVIVSLPLSLLVAAAAGRALFGAAQAIRRGHRASWIADKVKPLHLDGRVESQSRIDIAHPAIDL